MDGTAILGMYASGSVKFTRNSTSDKTVSFSGTIATTMSSTGQGYYSDAITAELHIGSIGSASHAKYSWTIYDYPANSDDHSKHEKNISGSFTLDNNTDDVYIVYFCNFHGERGGCDTGTPHTTVFKLPKNKLPYNPHKKPSVSVSGTTWTKYGSSRTATVTYDLKGDTTAHTLKVDTSGYSDTTTDITSGTSKSYTFTPSASRDTMYAFTANMYPSDDTSYANSASATFGIWSLPDIRIFSEPKCST